MQHDLDDIGGARELLNKYCYTDVGLRNARLSYRQYDPGHIINGCLSYKKEQAAISFKPLKNRFYFVVSLDFKHSENILWIKRAK